MADFLIRLTRGNRERLNVTGISDSARVSRKESAALLLALSELAGRCSGPPAQGPGAAYIELPLLKDIFEFLVKFFGHLSGMPTVLSRLADAVFTDQPADPRPATGGGSEALLVRLRTPGLGTHRFAAAAAAAKLEYSRWTGQLRRRPVIPVPRDTSPPPQAQTELTQLRTEKFELLRRALEAQFSCHAQNKTISELSRDLQRGVEDRERLSRDAASLNMRVEGLIRERETLEARSRALDAASTAARTALRRRIAVLRSTLRTAATRAAAAGPPLAAAESAAKICMRVLAELKMAAAKPPPTLGLAGRKPSRMALPSTAKLSDLDLSLTTNERGKSKKKTPGVSIIEPSTIDPSGLAENVRWLLGLQEDVDPIEGIQKSQSLFRQIEECCLAELDNETENEQ